MRKGIVFLSSILLLAACDTDSVEETPTDDQNETDTPTTEVEEDMEEDVEQEDIVDDETDDEADDTQDLSDDTTQTTDGTHLFASFVNEETFMDPYALEAWEDYQEVVADATYGEITLIQTENPDISQLDSSSFSEIEERFDSINLRDDVYMEQLDINESEELYFYRYPAEEGSELSEVSDFLAELTFYFIDDNLVFSSITPGLYQVELNDLPDADMLTTFTTVPEITSINSQVFTIAELNVNDYLIHQMMIPATFVNEEGNDEIMAFYFFTHGEDIIHYAFLPFEMVSQSFPDNSIILYQQIIPEIAAMDLEETL